MNDVMEKKLMEYKKIMCIDGTHGTNRKNWELTIVLIKDQNNMGFPVAFLLTNRLDQIIQLIFFRALKQRMGKDVQAEYIMSDDDRKYYNAWTQVMETEEKPKRLLCTWHVIKNWNIQGRAKIKNPEIRYGMKKKMREILTETNIEQFNELKDKYFTYLAQESEVDFLNYMEKYYFQSEERIKMWAHCHRLNAGINTNMAIENLNKVLKYNKMNGQRNIRIEKLLDLLEELVKEKMWKTIINSERPNANNYQHKVTVAAHKKAELQFQIEIELIDCGKFQVQSFSVSNKFYTVNSNALCDKDCRTVYCHQCKICIHRYKCNCPDNSVKTAMCKHIHAVALFEKRSESVLDTSQSSSQSKSQIDYQNELNHFIEEHHRTENVPTHFEKRREIAIEEVRHFSKTLETLDEKCFEEFMDGFRKLKNNVERKNNELCRKRKIENQSYYQNKE
ncbi:hypothetical protein ABEB36_014625 [Hypothenemus hampei]